MHISVFSILKQMVDEQDSQKQYDSLERIEVQGHRLVDGPSHHHQSGDDKQRNLQDAADDYPDREVDSAVLGRFYYGSTFGGIACDREKNCGYKGPGDVRGFGCGVDTVEEEV